MCIATQEAGAAIVPEDLILRLNPGAALLSPFVTFTSRSSKSHSYVASQVLNGAALRNGLPLRL